MATIRQYGEVTDNDDHYTDGVDNDVVDDEYMSPNNYLRQICLYICRYG